MTMTLTHLLDDATPGGVTRVIDGLRGSDVLKRQANHELQMVANRGRWPIFDSEVIVSHLALNHFVPGADPAITEEDWTRALRETWDGPLTLGRDGMRLAL